MKSSLVRKQVLANKIQPRRNESSFNFKLTMRSFSASTASRNAKGFVQSCDCPLTEKLTVSIIYVAKLSTDKLRLTHKNRKKHRIFHF